MPARRMQARKPDETVAPSGNVDIARVHASGPVYCRASTSASGMRTRPSESLILVTPYLAGANNGNWRTAARWARMLAPRCRVIVLPPDASLPDDAVALVALHARRSRHAVARWKAAHPDRALVVALTGTDLYRDLPAGDRDAIASVADADRLIVLQGEALASLDAGERARTSVVVQSARALVPFARKATSRCRTVLVAHLRSEKDPVTALDAWRRLPRDLAATLTIVGAALEEPLADAVRRATAADRRVRWLGARPHAWTRQAIRRAHALIVTSRMEGGANVVVEALTSGTPVIGTRIPGNVGLVGAGYDALFPAGDAKALADLVMRAARDRRWLAALERECAHRGRRMTPENETRALVAAIDAAIASKRGG